MRIFVLISTIDEGLTRLPDLLPTRTEGVVYIVSWQQTADTPSENVSVIQAEQLLKQRSDVIVTTLAGRGLSRNRNHAIAVAMDNLKDTLEDAVFVIADDDERLMPEAYGRIRSAYKKYPKMDCALFRLRSITDGNYFKIYPDKVVRYGRHPRSYYPCSWEMTFRARVWHTGIRFDERFGLGSEQLCAGEEDVLLADVISKGLKVLLIPEDIGYTEPITTGIRKLDVKVLRSKGAYYGYQRSCAYAFIRSLREALSLGWKHKVSPFRLFSELWWGVKFIRSWRHS